VAQFLINKWLNFYLRNTPFKEIFTFVPAPSITIIVHMPNHPHHDHVFHHKLDDLFGPRSDNPYAFLYYSYTFLLAY